MRRAVITTIYPPSETAATLVERFPNLVVIGDRKTPADWCHNNAAFWSFEQQQALDFDLLNYLPADHYARKNIGYLLAMRDLKTGALASCIYDTDDDNVPNEHWIHRNPVCLATEVSQPGWLNAYSLFEHSVEDYNQLPLWPRGLPLSAAFTICPDSGAPTPIYCPIQQGLADGSPDVDAIFRLLTKARPAFFRGHKSITLSSGTWCPFNSQSTWWFPDAFPLMYLPVHATFRMTDIWRSFVAQRCLWALGGQVAFHSPAEVVQKRNPHDLLRDFSDEIPGYLQNEAIVELLDSLSLKIGPSYAGVNMLACYEAMVRAGFLPAAELQAVEAWVSDVDELSRIG